MSYKCEKCGETHHGKQNKRVAETRTVTYNISVLKGYGRGGVEKKPSFYTTSTGWEIVKEQMLCDPCSKIMADVPARVNNKEKVMDVMGTKPKERLEEVGPVYNDYEQEKYSQETETRKES